MAVERYPDFLAGQRVSADVLTLGQPMLVYKTSDTSRTSTSSTGDPHLTLEVAANAVYNVRGLLFVDGTNESTDITVDWNAPSGSTGMWSGIGQPTTATGSDGTVRTIGTGITASRDFGVDNAGTSSPLTITVNGLLITSSTAGTYELSWACAASSGTVTLLSPSFLILQRFA